MQFKIVSALIFATLAAAATTPDSNPANTTPAKISTNPTTGNTNPVNTNQGTTTVNPPYPATDGGLPPTISASKCDSGHLRCCKSSGLPTDPAVAALLPSSTKSFTGYAGFNCIELPVGAQASTCSSPEKPLCCTDFVNGGTSIGCNPATLGL